MNTIYAERQIIRESSRRDELNIYMFRRTKLARAANKMQGRRRAQRLNRSKSDGDDIR